MIGRLLVLVDDVFKRDERLKMCSIKLVSIQCCSMISKIVCGGVKALTLGRHNEQPNQTSL